jgi:hypothetical protein
MIGTWKQQFLAAATQAFESDTTSNAEQERIELAPIQWRKT